MDNRPGSHKRSKSSRILGAYRSSDPSKDGSSSDVESPDGTLLSHPSADRLTPTTSNISMTSTSPIEPTHTHLASAENQKPPATGLSTTPSIEDSVRTFKVFEALRSKDGTAITKAIQDSTRRTRNLFLEPQSCILPSNALNPKWLTRSSTMLRAWM